MRGRLIQDEKKTIETMVGMFCKAFHQSSGLCEDCADLRVYSLDRLDKCRFGDRKPSCNDCPIHCYSPEMRTRIRKVMRYSGPRMIYEHPLMAIRHMINNRKSKTII